MPSPRAASRRFSTSIRTAGSPANAYYWLGESYYVTQNYKIALQIVPDAAATVS